MLHKVLSTHRPTHSPRSRGLKHHDRDPQTLRYLHGAHLLKPLSHIQPEPALRTLHRYRNALFPRDAVQPPFQKLGTDTPFLESGQHCKRVQGPVLAPDCIRIIPQDLLREGVEPPDALGVEDAAGA